MIRIKRHTLVNALHAAADQYRRDAQEVGAQPGHVRLAKQFSRQAREACKLAEQVEQADDIELED